ncbi:MAG: dihydroorotate dehydrogenase [Synergistaceae bacterium]|nr:dihydroorotate dehydrogenase [Synergistaceae bacterium]MBQ6001976.1 dihydroorotate dehydrogenase [Synergistaceae bacterium]MBQ6664958.1 dihydroorotate dehydrogenase [Synergistaceae bacterium]
MTDITTRLSGINLDNPIIPASGTFGYGFEFSELYDLNILGSISIKGTTQHPRYGNKQPRIAECPCGMINSVGLQNPGIMQVINEELPKLGKIFHKPVIANISGFSVSEYVYCASLIDKVPNVGIIEVNISCPNVHGGGLAFGTDPSSVSQITREVKAVTTKPVYIKLTPNVTDITEIAKSAENSGADGLSLINTLLGMRIDIKTRRPVIANKMGGLSGPAIFPVALRMVYQVHKAVKIPVIGIGGISSAYDVIEMMMAGASAVQIGSANLVDPLICKKIIDELPEVCERLKISRISDIIGAAE